MMIDGVEVEKCIWKKVYEQESADKTRRKDIPIFEMIPDVCRTCYGFDIKCKYYSPCRERYENK